MICARVLPCSCQAHHSDTIVPRSACLPANVSAALERAMPRNATDRACAYWNACVHSRRQPFTKGDTLAYFNASWHPNEAHGGVACSRLSRFGAPFVHSFGEHRAGTRKGDVNGGRSSRRGDKRGDGGKTLCHAETLLRSPGCVVLSVGINDDTAFERHLHRARPECRIIGMDGTLPEDLRRHVPSFVELIPENFGPSTHSAFAHLPRISLLKLDCEHCEYKSLPPFLDRVCVEQLVVEMGPAVRD